MPVARASFIRALAACGAVAATSAAQVPDNVPFDTDGNGKYDFVRVADWDGDEVLETADVQAAIDALDDPGPKHVWVAPGDFQGPQPRQGHVITLPSRMLLEGSGQDVTILHGFGPQDLESTQAVIANANHWNGGNREIEIVKLTIDGGWLGGETHQFGHARMGVHFRDCTQCSVRFVTVRNTLHTCLYTANGQDVTFSDNVMERCGNVFGTGAPYPCVYLFAPSGTVLEHVLVADNICIDSGAASLNTRRGDVLARISDVHFLRNYVTSTDAVPAPADCMSLTGVESSTFVDNTCTRTGPVSYGSAGYYSEGKDPSATMDILIDGLTIEPGPGGHGMSINGFLEDSILRNVHIMGGDPDRSCVEFLHPFRNVVFEEIELENCGRIGFNETGLLGMGTTPGEALTLRDVSVHLEPDTGGEHAALLFRGDVRNLTVDGLRAAWIDGNGIEMRGDVFDTVIRDSEIRQVSGAGVQVGPGAMIEDLEVRGNTIEDTGDAGIRLSMSSSAPSLFAVVADNTISDCCGSTDAAAIEVAGNITGLWVGDNSLEDPNGAADLGLELDVSAAGIDPRAICSNSFSGAFTVANRYHVAGQVAQYRDDGDSDSAVDACDCAPFDPTVVPHATELNDGRDNNCPGDPDWGLVDETAPESGFHDPDDPNVYSWPMQPGALDYRVVRSITPTFEQCYGVLTGTPALSDPSLPPPGGCFFYLNRAQSPLPGSWGRRSNGSERTNICGE